MKLGIISDIHSNIYAFRACMERLVSLGCEEFVFLGDFVSDTPYAAETMEEIYGVMRQYPVQLLRGNREEYLLEQRAILSGDKEGIHWIDNSCSGNLKFTLEALTDKDLDFFEKLPITFVYEKEGYPSITFCHGSPVNTRELMQIDGDNTRRWLQEISTDYLIAAHTHHPGYGCYGDRTYINTGACGIAITDYGYAQCVMLECEEQASHKLWAPTFLKVPYDVQQVVKDIFATGLFDRAKWFLNANIHILLTGTDLCAQLVQLAAELKSTETGVATVWPDIPEPFFEKAAKQLGIPDYSELREKL